MAGHVVCRTQKEQKHQISNSRKCLLIIAHISYKAESQKNFTTALKYTKNQIYQKTTHRKFFCDGGGLSFATMHEIIFITIFFLRKLFIYLQAPTEKHIIIKLKEKRKGGSKRYIGKPIEKSQSHATLKFH